MLESLVDHPVWMYVALGLVALGLLVGLWATRKRGFAFGLAVVAVAALLVWLLTVLVPTDRKQIVAAVNDMGQGVRTKDAKRIFANISEQFRLAGLGKDSFRQLVAGHLERGDVTEVVVYGLEDPQVSRPTRTATVEFMVKPKGSGVPEGMFYACKATFALDPDDRWRLKGFDLSDPVTNQPIQIPALH